MDVQKAVPGRAHTVSVSGRKKVGMTGITEVKLATETKIVLKTSCGDLVLTGAELKISKFSTDDGVLEMDGNLNAFGYSDTAGGETEKKGFLKKLLR